MSAAEPDRHTETDEYITLFHRYISRSVEALIARLGPELQELTNDTREQAWHLLDYALKLAHGWAVACDLLLALAPRMERDGFRHEWLPFLERGVACCQRANDLGGEAQLCLYIGRIHRLRSDYALANTWFEASAIIYQQLDDHAGRAKALNQLAYVARLQSQFDEAKELVNEALSLLDEDDVERGTSHWVLGTVAQYQLDWTLAERHHQMALEIWKKSGDQLRIAWGLQNLGDTLRYAERFTEAAEYIQQAITLLGDQHDVTNQGIARMNLGVIYLYRDDAEKAQALFALAESVFRQVDDQLHLAMVYTNLTIAERELQNWQAAELAGQRALQLSQVLENGKFMANAKDELGMVYLVQNRRAEAITVFEEGLTIIGQVAVDPFQKLVQSSLLAHLEDAKQLGDT